MKQFYHAVQILVKMEVTVKIRHFLIVSVVLVQEIIPEVYVRFLCLVPIHLVKITQFVTTRITSTVLNVIAPKVSPENFVMLSYHAV